MRTRTEKTIQKIEQILKSDMDTIKNERNRSHYSPFSCYLTPRANLYNQYPFRTPVSSKRLKKSIKKAKSKSTTRATIPKPFLLNNSNEEYHQLSNSAKKAFISGAYVKSQAVQTSLGLILDQSDSSADPITFAQKQIGYLINHLNRFIIRSFFNRWKQRWFYQTAYSAQKFIKSSPLYSQISTKQRYAKSDCSDYSYTEECGLSSEGSMVDERSRIRLKISKQTKNEQSKAHPKRSPSPKRDHINEYNYFSDDEYYEPKVSKKPKTKSPAKLNKNTGSFSKSKSPNKIIRNSSPKKSLASQNKYSSQNKMFNDISSGMDSDMNTDDIYNQSNYSKRLDDNPAKKNKTRHHQIDDENISEIIPTAKNEKSRNTNRSFQDEKADSVSSQYIHRNDKPKNDYSNMSNVSPTKKSHQAHQNKQEFEVKLNTRERNYSHENSSYIKSQRSQLRHDHGQSVERSHKSYDSRNKFQDSEISNDFNSDKDIQEHNSYRNDSSDLDKLSLSSKRQSKYNDLGEDNDTNNSSKHSIHSPRTTSLADDQPSTRKSIITQQKTSKNDTIKNKPMNSPNGKTTNSTDRKVITPRKLYTKYNSENNIEEEDTDYSKHLSRENSEIVDSDEDPNYIQSDEENPNKLKSKSYNNTNAISPIMPPVAGPDELISRLIPDLEKFVSKYSNSGTYNWSVEDESDADFKKLVEKSRYYSAKYSTSTLDITESVENQNVNTSTFEYPDLIPVNTDLSIPDNNTIQNNSSYIPELHEFDNEAPNAATNSPPIYK